MLYGILALITFAIAMASHHAPTIKYGILMLLSWAASNLCVASLGFERAPILIIPIDGVIALWVAQVAFKGASKVGVAIFLLFAEEMAVHCVAFLTYATGHAGYWMALNVIFATQVLINGTAGVSHGLAYWSDRLRHIPHSAMSRR